MRLVTRPEMIAMRPRPDEEAHTVKRGALAEIIVQGERR